MIEKEEGMDEIATIRKQLQDTLKRLKRMELRYNEAFDELAEIDPLNKVTLRHCIEDGLTTGMITLEA